LVSFKEQEKQCSNGKPNGGEPLWETPKVAMCSILADEVVVANISKKSGSNDLTSEGLHMVMLFIVEQVA
jgi:hypothetical protein